MAKGVDEFIENKRNDIFSFQGTHVEKMENPFTGVVSGNYWTQTGMPWVTSEGRKAVLTEWFWQPIRGQPRRVDTNELRAFSQTFWIHACVKTLIDEVSSLDWDIVAKDEYEYEQVRSFIIEVKQFLEYPNKNGESFTALLKSLIKDILELDAGVLVKVFDVGSYDFDHLEPKSGSPLLKPFGQRTMKELYARDGASFLKETDKFGFVRGYWQYSYQIPAHPMWFNRDEICYVMESPRSMSTYGYARTQAILDIVKSLQYSTLYNKKFFEEVPLPEGVLSLLDTNETEMKTFMDWWNREFKAQPHKLGLVNKDIKWQSFTIPNKELEFLETQVQYFKFVISMFGLTPEEMGITEGLSRATAATQAELSKRKGIRPLLKLIEKYINGDIIPEFGFPGIEFSFIYDDPAEKAAKLDNWAKELDMGVATINEVREELGKEPLEGGDRSNNIQPEPMIGDNQKDQMSQAEQGQAPNYHAQRDRAEGKTESKKFSKADYKTMQLSELIAEHKKLVRILESGDREELKREAEEQKKELEEYIRESKNNATKGLKTRNKGIYDGQYYNVPQEVIKPHHGAIIQPQANEQLDPTVYQDLPGKRLAYPGIDSPQQPETTIGMKCPMCGKDTLTNFTSADDIGSEQKYRCTNCAAILSNEELEQNMMESMENTMESNPHDKPITIPHWSPKSINNTVKSWTGLEMSKSMKKSKNYAESNEYDKLLKTYFKDLSAASREKLKRILKEEISKNSTIRQIRKRIIKELGIEKERAESIARTETVRIVNRENEKRMRSDRVKKVMWLTARDERVCKICGPRNKKTYNLKSMQGEIPVHPNCRCTLSEI